MQDVTDSSSTTLLQLLSRIASKMNKSLPAVMVGNMVTGGATGRPTTLQIALGNIIQGKSNIELLHDFGVTS